MIKPDTANNAIQGQKYLFSGGYNTVMDYLRKEYRKQREAFLPLEFELGAYAEVDWTEAYFYLKGKETKAHLFVMKLRGSGGFYVRAYPFECTKTAVKKILEGSKPITFMNLHSAGRQKGAIKVV